jgi:DNA (cytosine-5)-methyltransferase 1
VRVGSLFTGIGGWDLAVRNLGWETIWASEIHPLASVVFGQQFPNVPNLGDIRGVGADADRPDLLVASFPCQDVSHANAARRLGVDGPNSGLWREALRLTRVLGPDYLVLENVPGLLTSGFERILDALAFIGFDAEWECLPASAFGAPHVRDRVWLVAYPSSFVADCQGRQVFLRRHLWGE